MLINLQEYYEKNVPAVVNLERSSSDFRNDFPANLTYIWKNCNKLRITRRLLLVQM